MAQWRREGDERRRVEGWMAQWRCGLRVGEIEGDERRRLV